ncbi:MAG: lipoate--protein ligase family protein, partial [Limisphaerales bacterium]
MNFWYLMDSGLCEAAFNMALDEALLEGVSRLGRPVMRFYGWTAPAASFGYFQKLSHVEQATRLRPLVRRPTGGGIVPHNADWTYSFAAPPGHEWHSLTATESYRRIHEWIRAAFARLNVDTRLALEKKSPGTGDEPKECFTGHEKFDLLWHGMKIAGAAQRRNKLGLLVQGSVQPPKCLDRADWQQAMRGAASEVYSIQWRDLIPDPRLLERTG